MMFIQKLCKGIVNNLPKTLNNKSLAAFQLINHQAYNTHPYIGPATTPGQFGNQIFLYGPRLQKWDISLVKRTRLAEGKNIEFRAQALTILNHPNFFLVPNGAGNITLNNL